MKTFLALVLLIGGTVTLLYLMLTIAALTDYRNDGMAFEKTKKTIDNMKYARLLGKVMLLPVLLYNIVIDIVAFVFVMIYLFIKACVVYCFDKDMSFKEQIEEAYGIKRYLYNGNTARYYFMGYTWSKDYVNTDIEW